MLTDREMSEIADPDLDQHFLISDEKLSQLIAAAQIRATDNVVEVGAGIGTVARVLPKSKTLTVIELDERLTGFLRKNVPHANVLQGDALTLVQAIACDVLISNLPTDITESLITVLPHLSFRTAVLAVGEKSDLSKLGGGLTWFEVTTITGADFVPPQESVSRIVRVSREE